MTIRMSMRLGIWALPMLVLVGCATEPAGSSASSSTVIRQLAKSTVSWNGAALPHYPKGQPEVTILEITIPAGVRLPTHYHPVINAAVMLSGELTVMSLDGDRRHLAGGDTLVELVDTLHYGIN